MKLLNENTILVASVVVLVALLLVPQLHRGGLSGYDDALYASEAKQMVASGDWWSIHFNGGPNFEYPPMFIWLDAISIRVFGVSDFAAKFPAAIAAIATLPVLYLLVLELTGDAWLGILSMLILATTQPFLKYATHAMTDVPFTLFFALALLFYLKGLRHPKYLLGAGLAVALAVLTRSLLGLLPVGIMFVHCILNRRKKWSYSHYALGGLLIAIALPLAWGASQYQIHGPEFLRQHFSFISNKVLGSGSATPSLHVLPYAKELLKYYWPWLPVFLIGLITAFRARKNGQGDRTAFAILWLAFVILPLVLIETTYGRYLMPAFPAMALVCAMTLDRWITPARRRVVFGVFCTALVGAAAYTILFPSPERGLDMRTLAAAANNVSQPGQRLLLYAHGERRFDFQNQLLWYGDHDLDLIADESQLKQRQTPGQVGIVDKASFAIVQSAIANVRVVAESENFVCYLVISAA